MAESSMSEAHRRNRHTLAVILRRPSHEPRIPNTTLQLYLAQCSETLDMQQADSLKLTMDYGGMLLEYPKTNPYNFTDTVYREHDGRGDTATSFPVMDSSTFLRMWTTKSSIFTFQPNSRREAHFGTEPKERFFACRLVLGRVRFVAGTLFLSWKVAHIGSSLTRWGELSVCGQCCA
jgi:hypothetical protein